MKKINFIYFGGEPLGVPILETLLAHNLSPQYVVTSLDRKSGRGRLMTAPPTKQYAETKNIPVLQPTDLADPEFLSAVSDAEVFVVVAYNKILPQWFLDIPKKGVLNVHPSLLPRYRGPSPVRSAILADDATGVGVSVMLLDAKMDHGPILSQTPYTISPANWPPSGTRLEKDLATLGGQLLAETLPLWIENKIVPTEQSHTEASYTKKFTKEMGELVIDIKNLPHGEEAHQTLLKIRAFDTWPGTFFFHKAKRVKIIDAHINNDRLVLDKVIPEGKKLMSFDTYVTTIT